MPDTRIRVAQFKRPSTSLQTTFFERNGKLFLEQHNGKPEEQAVHRKVQAGDKETFAKEYQIYKQAGGKL